MNISPDLIGFYGPKPDPGIPWNLFFILSLTMLLTLSQIVKFMKGHEIVESASMILKVKSGNIE